MVLTFNVGVQQKVVVFSVFTVWAWLVTGLNHLGAEPHFDVSCQSKQSEACEREQKGSFLWLTCLHIGFELGIKSYWI